MSHQPRGRGKARRTSGTSLDGPKAETSQERQARTRLAFAWHELPVEPRCEGTVWIHGDGEVECCSAGCDDPTKVYHPLTARQKCRRDKATKKQCPRCAHTVITLPPEAVDPMFWMKMIREFAPGARGAIDTVMDATRSSTDSGS